MAGTYSYRIEPRYIDATLRARVYSVGDLILQAANDDADMLGFGVRDLNLGNASWVLSRMAVEMSRLPARHEVIDIYTWVSDYGRLFTTRNMTVSVEAPADGGSGQDGSYDGSAGCAGKGGSIGAAVTLWAMIDLDTRRPLDLSPLSNKATSLVDREPPIEKPRKVGPVECSVERPYIVAYSDIDFNGHVNSMKYLEWMVDTLPAGVPENLGPFRLDINYMHEAKQGEQVAICYGVDGAGVHHFDIKNGEGLSICKATITNDY